MPSGAPNNVSGATKGQQQCYFEIRQSNNKRAALSDTHAHTTPAKIMIGQTVKKSQVGQIFSHSRRVPSDGGGTGHSIEAWRGPGGNSSCS